MAKQNYLIQRIVEANSISEALRDENKGAIVEVCLVHRGNKSQLVTGVGFMYNTDKLD